MCVRGVSCFIALGGGNLKVSVNRFTLAVLILNEFVNDLISETKL